MYHTLLLQLDASPSRLSSHARCSQVVITGVGSLSSVGIGSDTHYKALLDGTNGIETLPEWADEYPCTVSAPLIALL